MVLKARFRSETGLFHRTMGGFSLGINSSPSSFLSISDFILQALGCFSLTILLPEKYFVLSLYLQYKHLYIYIKIIFREDVF